MRPKQPRCICGRGRTRTGAAGSRSSRPSTPRNLMQKAVAAKAGVPRRLASAEAQEHLDRGPLGKRSWVGQGASVELLPVDENLWAHPRAREMRQARRDGRGFHCRRAGGWALRLVRGTGSESGRSPRRSPTAATWSERRRRKTTGRAQSGPALGSAAETGKGQRRPQVSPCFDPREMCVGRSGARRGKGGGKARAIGGADCPDMSDATACTHTSNSAAGLPSRPVAFVTPTIARTPPRKRSRMP